MSSLPSDLLQKVVKHYGSYDIRAPRPSDVPIVLNCNQIAANLQSGCEGKWERECLLESILSEVARFSKKKYPRNFGCAFSAYTLLAMPNTPAEEARQTLDELDVTIAWDSSKVSAFLGNFFYHSSGSSVRANAHLEAGCAMVYGDYIFSETSTSSEPTRGAASLRVGKLFSTGASVANLNVYKHSSATVAQYIEHCLIFCNAISVNRATPDETMRKLVSLVDAPKGAIDLLFDFRTIYFVANYVTENALYNISTARVFSLDNYRPIAETCPHKYYTFRDIERQAIDYFEKAEFPDSSRALMYRTFIPIEVIKEVKLTKDLKKEVKTFIIDFLCIRGSLFQGEMSKKLSREKNVLMCFKMFLDYCMDGMKHWQTLAAFVCDFYWMLYNEQTFRIIRQPEAAICSHFANTRDLFDQKMLELLEKFVFSSCKAGNHQPELPACANCKPDFSKLMK